VPGLPGCPCLLWSTTQHLAKARKARRDKAAVVPGPEYAWPKGRAWVLNSDYDLSSSYVACDGALAGALQEDKRLELLPVTLDTRIDDGADLHNGTGWEHL